MLISCPECGLQVSSKAAFCPHCGYVTSDKPIKVSSKRRRLPNGFGQISEIKGRNLRNPYRVMVSAGKDENGRPISKLLQPKAYFKTYNDAYTALVEYNQSPYDPKRDPLFEDLYEEWLEYKMTKVENPETRRQYQSAFSHLTKLHKYKLSQIRSYHIREAIESEKVSDTLKSKMKVLCNMLFDYAMERELVQRNYARELRLGLTLPKFSDAHSAYTEDEMKLLWANINQPAVFAQLLQCYTGFRPQEVLNIALNDIDLNQMTIKGGMKTAAGRNRLVPIHPQLQGLIKDKYKHTEGYTYLIHNIGRSTNRNNPVPYHAYSFALETFWRDKGTTHRPHDGRIHFITMAKKYKLDEYAIKYIVGHQIKDLTERVYTKREIDWLKSEISKIPPREFFGL